MIQNEVGKIDQHSFTFAYLSKEVETLGVNTEKKFSFNSSRKTCRRKAGQLICDFSGMALHLDNDYKGDFTLDGM